MEWECRVAGFGGRAGSKGSRGIEDQESKMGAEQESRLRDDIDISDIRACTTVFAFADHIPVLSNWKC